MDHSSSLTENRKSRNYGIDLLRIVCMYMICILHVNGQGGAMTHHLGMEASWKTVVLLEVISYCACNTYGMISGYVGIDVKRRPARIVELWLTVFWYSALGTLIGVFAFHLPAEEDTLWKAGFPTMWKTYWYFSSYVGVFFIAPYLNKMVKTLGDTEKKRLCLMLFLLTSVFTMVPRASTTGSDFLGIGAGYSFLWLAVMYVTGACIRELTREEGGSDREEKKDLLHRGRLFYLLLFAVCVILTWLSRFLIEDFTKAVYGQARYVRLLYSYAGPTMVISAYALLMIFKGIQPSGGIRKIIRILSPMAFSVYLVQVQPYFWNYALKGECSFIAGEAPLLSLVMVLGCAALLYLFCTVIDIPRMLVFRLLHIRRLTQRFTDWVLRPFDKMTQ